MATYLALVTFTDQGVKKFKDTCKRAADFTAKAKKMGADVKQIYWTLGAYDGAVIFEAGDDEAATGAMLYLGSLGNVTTETMRAFTAPEMQNVVRKSTA